MVKDMGNLMESRTLTKPTRILGFQAGWILGSNETHETNARYSVSANGCPLGKLETGANGNFQKFKFRHGVIIRSGVVKLEGQLVSGPDRLQGEILWGDEIE